MENEQNTKKNLMDVSVKLFSEKGYDSVGVQEICTKAEITKPTLYYYFGSKSGLLQNIIDEYGKNFLKKIEDAANYEHDFQKSLTKLYKAAINFAKDNKAYFAFHCILMNAPDGSESAEVFSPVKAGLESAILKFFKNSCNEFGNMKGKEKLYSILFHGNLYSVAQAYLNGKIKNNEETIYAIVHSFMYGIAN